MKIGIIGQGFVGNAVYEKFKSFYEVKTFDLDSSKCNSTEKDVIENCRIIFVCLPTPMNQDGSCNTDIVEGTISKINSHNKKTIVVIKSTIPPGTTKKLNLKYTNISICFNPEFLTEKNAIADYNNQSRVILGGHEPSVSMLSSIFSIVFPSANIILTDSTHAEMVKYVTNAFLSVKVSFANEIYQLCKKLQIDYDTVIEYSKQDARLGNSHWSVPGPDGDFGFGGHCFPKDLSAIIKLSEDLDTVNNILYGALKTNNAVRNNRDWEKMKGRAIV